MGEILTGLVVMHSCDNPRCTNPDHLCVGTQAENIADMVAKGRRRDGHFDEDRRRIYSIKNRGENGNNTKLSERDVLDIRADQRSRDLIAADHGITPRNVKAIQNRESWKHL